MSRTCVDCGRPLSFQNEFVVDGRHICRDCRANRDPEFRATLTPYASQFGPIASLTSRFVGQFLDALVAYAIGFGSYALVSAIAPDNFATAFLPIILGLAYFLLADGLPGGQSLGKRVTRIRVVNARNGEPCTPGRSALRNVLQILGILDWLFIFGRMHQRLGDMAANTIVVRLTEASSRQAAEPPAAGP